MAHIIKNTANAHERAVERVGQIAIVVALLILGMTASSVSALMLEKNLNELTDEANYIVVGNVKEVKSAWDDNKTNIYTNVTIGIEKVVKGKKIEREVIVKIQGGEVGDLKQWVEGEPEFVSGEKVLLFLSREDKGKGFILKSRFQGKYTIEGDRAINKELNRNISAKEFIDALQQRNKDPLYDVESAAGNEMPAATTTGCYYSYSDRKWTQILGGNVYVQFYKNVPDTWSTSVDNGAFAWNGVAKFSFQDHGSTGRGGPIQDGYSTVCRGTIDGPGGTLAQTTIWYHWWWPWWIAEADIKFDGAESWYAGTGTCPINQYDVWNVAAHEFGHWLQLNDLYISSASEETMYGYASIGETKKRNIYCGDIYGIRYIYGY